MNLKAITIGLLLGTGFTWLIWDIYAESKGGDPVTISVVIRKASLQSPFIPFAFGVLMGHWFAS